MDDFQDWAVRYDTETLQTAYQLSMTRLIEADAKLWQVPGLSLTAHAFLLTIALGTATYTTWERVAAAAMGIVVALASIQLMKRHMYHSLCDVALLNGLERIGVMPPISNRVHMPNTPRARGLAGLRSARVWIATLALFVAVNLGVIGFALPDLW